MATVTGLMFFINHIVRKQYCFTDLSSYQLIQGKAKGVDSLWVRQF